MSNGRANVCQQPTRVPLAPRRLPLSPALSRCASLPSGWHTQAQLIAAKPRKGAMTPAARHEPINEAEQANALTRGRPVVPKSARVSGDGLARLGKQLAAGHVDADPAAEVCGRSRGNQSGWRGWQRADLPLQSPSAARVALAAHPASPHPASARIVGALRAGRSAQRAEG